MNSPTPTIKALRLYASYLIEVLNDKETGNEQLARARDMGTNRVAHNFDFNGDDEGGMSGGLSADGSPCIFISADPEKLGQITHCNMSLCKLFGFTSRDLLIGHDVERLMPRIYASQHKRFLLQALSKPPDLLSSKDKQVFGRHSTGYIFPITLSIRSVSSFITGRQFAATFRQDKPAVNKNYAYLILDKSSALVEASTSCINLLDIDIQRYNRLNVKITMSNHLDALFGQNQYVYHNKQGSLIDYTFPRLLTKEQGVIEDMMNRGNNIEDGDESVQDVDDEEIMHNDRYHIDVSSRIPNRIIGGGAKHSKTKLLSMVDDEEEKGLQKGLTNRSRQKTFESLMEGSMIQSVRSRHQSTKDDEADAA